MRNKTEVGEVGTTDKADVGNVAGNTVLVQQIYLASWKWEIK